MPKTLWGGAAKVAIEEIPNTDFKLGFNGLSPFVNPVYFPSELNIKIILSGFAIGSLFSEPVLET